MTAYDVVASSILVHHVEQYLLYARALFVDGIVERVNQMVHTLYYLVPVQSLGCRSIVFLHRKPCEGLKL